MAGVIWELLKNDTYKILVYQQGCSAPRKQHLTVSAIDFVHQEDTLLVTSAQ